MTLDRETAVITGAGRGIGEAIAHAFARAGSNLVLLSRTQAEIEQVARQTAALGVTSVALSGEVSRRSEVERIMAAALEKVGRIDVLVNAAGIYGPLGPPVQDGLEEVGQGGSIHLLGAVFCMHACLPHMLARGKGVVINFSGGGAVAPFPRFSAYSASKAAVVRLTETVAEEVKDSGVRINAIAPGAVNTRLLDQILAAQDRAGKEFYAKALEQKANGGTPPELAAELAVFLASPAAAWVPRPLISPLWGGRKSRPQQAQKLKHSAMFTLLRIDGRQFAEVRR